MSYLVLARKYRPQTFEEVVGQSHVSKTLTNAVLSSRVAHAILFSGPRGTGKTTIARILAKAMNCKTGPTPSPCNKCRSCREITSGNAADVFEIDGASNNSVDQIRDLRENIRYMPAHSQHKIYIIDEVHMLSIAAFNALLKTLEEPPAHVMFMFATTEPHKIPITILSRCQRHDLRRIDLDAIVAHMESLCEKELIDISKESLELIAKEASGSMRDGLSLLDQVMSCSEGVVTHEKIIDILGVIDRKIIFEISRAVLNREITEILTIFNEIYNRGIDFKKFYSNLMEHFRNLLVVKMGEKISKLVDVPAHEAELMAKQIKNVSETFLSQILDLLFSEESTIKFSSQPKLALEMTFIRIFQIQPALSIDTLIQKLDSLRKEVIGKQPEAIFSKANDTDNTGQQQEQKQNEIISEIPQNKVQKERQSPINNYSSDAAEDIDVTWTKLLNNIRKSSPPLGASLATSRLKNISDQSIEIEVNATLFVLNSIERKKDILKKISNKFFGRKMDVIINATAIKKDDSKKKKNDQMKQEAISHPLVSNAVEIFNGKIMDVKIL